MNHNDIPMSHNEFLDGIVILRKNIISMKFATCTNHINVDVDFLFCFFFSLIETVYHNVKCILENKPCDKFNELFLFFFFKFEIK